jgi:hypothetical protein
VRNRISHPYKTRGRTTVLYVLIFKFLETSEFATYLKLKGIKIRSSPNIVKVIKSRRMRWAGHVAHMGEG